MTLAEQIRVDIAFLRRQAEASQKHLQIAIEKGLDHTEGFDRGLAAGFKLAADHLERTLEIMGVGNENGAHEVQLANAAV